MARTILGVKKVGSWRFSGGFLEAWALPVASCLCRAYTMPTHYNILKGIYSDVYSSLLNSSMTFHFDSKRSLAYSIIYQISCLKHSPGGERPTTSL